MPSDSSVMLADRWAGFYHTAFAAGASVLAAGRPLKLKYAEYVDLHKYADDVASVALQAVVDVATEVRGAVRPATVDEHGDDVPF